MKKIITILLFVFVFFCSLAFATTSVTGDLTISGLRIDGESLYNSCRRLVQMGWPTDGAIYTASNSFSDLSDGPAGKYGSVSVNGTDLEMNSAPVRFFGTNWAYPWNWAEPDEIATQAHLYKFVGYNMLRIHGLDASRWQKGIYLNTTDTLSFDYSAGSELDKFDYNFAVLKQAGMYFWLVLYSSDRQFKPNDSLTGYSDFLTAVNPAPTDCTISYLYNCSWLDKGFQLMVYWNNEVKTLFYNYAYNLLTHVNPYTGLAYKDDPALAIVEFLNEPWVEEYLLGRDMMDDDTYAIDPGGISRYGGYSAIPANFHTTWDTSWNAWLLNKYGTVSAVKTAWLLDGTVTFKPEVDAWAMAGFTFKRPVYDFCAAGLYRGTWTGIADGPQCTDLYLWIRDSKTDFNVDTIIYFRNTIGWAGPINAEGSFEQSITSGDVGSKHYYRNHPTVQSPRGELTMTDYKEIGTAAEMGMPYPRNVGGSLAAQMLNGLTWYQSVPALIGEQRAVFPTEDAYASPLRVAVRLLNAGFDAINHFVYDGGLETRLENWEFDLDIQQVALTQLSSWIFLTHDPGDITVSPSDVGENLTGIEEHTATDYWAVMGNISGQSWTVAGMTITAGLNDGVIALFSKSHQPLSTATDLMLLTVGKIQQRGAFWVDSDTYNWGQDGVVEMLPVGIRISGNDASSIVVTPVAIDGTDLSTSLIQTYLSENKTTFDICAEGNTVWYKITR